MLWAQWESPVCAEERRQMKREMSKEPFLSRAGRGWTQSPARAQVTDQWEMVTAPPQPGKPRGWEWNSQEQKGSE